MSISNSLLGLIPPNQPVKAYFGLKRNQWPQRNCYKQAARSFLENGGVKAADIRCFIKTSGRSPQIDPECVNLFLKLSGKNTIDIIA